jgi:hypothetical protein
MILRRRRMLLVLDGIELLQERPGQAQHGRFLSDDLRALLLDLGREGQALVAITRRFATTEFKAHLGLSYRTIDLGGFTPGESVAFLKAASLSGNDESAPAGGSVSRALSLLQNATSLDERLAALLEWYLQNNAT